MEIRKLKLRDWLIFEETKLDLSNAIQDQDIDGIVKFTFELIALASNSQIEELENKDWTEILLALFEATAVNTPKNIPPFMKTPQKETDDLFTYKGHLRWLWLYLFCREFGWSIEYVENLDVETALFLYQEYLLHNQLEMEWEWSCSQNSIGYDETTKKSKFIELPRPEWMRIRKIEEIEKRIKPTRIRPEMLPVGPVIRLK